MNFKSNAAQCARNFRAAGPVKLAIAGVGVVAMLSSFANGQDLYWDATNNNGIEAGNGTWGTAKNWNPSLTPANGSGEGWTNGRTAVFQASGPSIVTVSGAVQVNGINFVGTGYTVAGTTLTLVTGSNIVTTQAGAISAPLAGTVGLTKLGPATLTLSGINSYSGPTSVSAGTLLVSGLGSLPAGSAVSVESGAFLTGTGTVGGATTVKSGGTLSPGTVGTAGTQSYTNGITFESGSIFQWDMTSGAADPGNLPNQGSYDRVTGNATGADAVFNIILNGGSFTDAFWNTNKSWNNIFGGTPDLLAIFSDGFGGDVAVSGLVLGRGSFSFSGSTLNWNAVPEPSSALAGILLGLGLLRRRRR